jgi:alpha-tubulin suppressor-like RCC1 family protein
MSGVRSWGIAAVIAASVVVSAGQASGDVNEAPVGALTAGSVVAGSNHTCALFDNGTMSCWGEGTTGQLGQGDPDDRGDQAGEMGADLPTVSLGPGRTVTAIAAGSLHTCALLDNSTVKCWGGGATGQHGYGTTANRGDQPGEMGTNLPTVDLGSGRTARAIAAGGQHTCALLDNSTVKCWGLGFFGQLGYGDPERRGNDPGEMGDNLPAVNLGTGRTARAISAGGNHTCALLDNGTIKCWGYNQTGQLGQGDDIARGNAPGQMGNALPVVDLGTGRTAIAVSAADSHTCALLDNGSVKCWGSGARGALGLGDMTIRGDDPGEMGNVLPAVDLGPGRTARSVSAGPAHTCALLDNATVKCWGEGDHGRTGHGDTSDRGDGPGEMGNALPVVDLGTGRSATAVTTGGEFSCALLDDATVKCWGENGFGQLGDGTNSPQGDAPGEMGDDLRAIDLPRLVGRAAGSISLRANRSSVVAGSPITYTVTVRNTGTIPLTGVVIEAPDSPACARTIPTIATRATTTYTCRYVTSATDLPQMSNQLFMRSNQDVIGQTTRVRTRIDARVVRADGLVRPGKRPFVGDNTYNSTGAAQTATATTTNRKPVRFTWRIQNDGNAKDRFVLRGTKGTPAFAVTYKRGKANITAAVRAGTFRTPSLAPGQRTDITVTVTPTKKARTGDTVTATLTARSAASSTVTDTVRATTTRR